MAEGAGELFSWRSPSARAYKAERDRLSDEQLLDLMLENPRLIRRPIVLRGDAIALGFDRSAIAGLLA